MGTSHTELSQDTHYEDPAGVFCPGGGKLRPISWLPICPWLPLCPWLPPHLHSSRRQARHQGGRGSCRVQHFRCQGDWLHQRVRFRCPLPDRGRGQTKRSADEEAEEVAA